METELEHYEEVPKVWPPEGHRTLGWLKVAPSNKRYMEDWAVVEIDTEKIGNTDVLDLGFEYKPDILTTVMFSRNGNSHKFECTDDRLLQIRGIIPDDDDRNPRDKDADNELWLVDLKLVKRSKTTGLTVGRANTVFSYTCKYFHDSIEYISMEHRQYGLLGSWRLEICRR